MNNFEVIEFPPEVINELDYYVYRLIDPRNGDTFYIGKGQGNRVFEHLKCSLIDDDEDETVDLKYQTIRDITKSGLNVIHVIHRHGMDSKTAFHVEAALIDAFPYTTNKVGGHNSNEIGPMNAYEILNRYKAETAKMNHKLILINVNRSVNERSVYDAVRFAWRIDVNRAKKAEYVLAVEKGIIVGVFKPNEWKSATLNNFPEFTWHNEKRYGFTGEEADDKIQKEYLHKRIPENYRKRGAAYPVKYSFR